MPYPEMTTVLAKVCEWTPEIIQEWETRVEPKFQEGERCSRANYHYNDTDEYGFVYVVQPGNHVCYERWHHTSGWR